MKLCTKYCFDSAVLKFLLKVTLSPFLIEKNILFYCSVRVINCTNDKLLARGLFFPLFQIQNYLFPVIRLIVLTRKVKKMTYTNYLVLAGRIVTSTTGVHALWLTFCLKKSLLVYDFNCFFFRTPGATPAKKSRAKKSYLLYSDEIPREQRDVSFCRPVKLYLRNTFKSPRSYRLYLATQ